MTATAEQTAREQLLAERRTGIGGSDVAPILGLPNPGSRTKLSVWMEKTGRTQAGEDNPILRRGRKLEPVVRSEYEEETGRRVVAQPFLRHPEYSWAIVHLDGVVHAPEHEDPGCFEGKAANVLKLYEWDGDEAPIAAQAQLMHGMFVGRPSLGTTWGSVAGLVGGLEVRYQDLEYHEDFIDRLVEELAAFWKLVEADTPPEPVADDVKRLDALFRMVEGEAVDLPDEAAEWDRVRLETSAEIKRLEALKKDAEAKLKFAIGQAERGRLPGGGSYTYREIQRKAYSVAATSYRQLRRAKR